MLEFLKEMSQCLVLFQTWSNNTREWGSSVKDRTTELLLHCNNKTHRYCLKPAVTHSAIWEQTCCYYQRPHKQDAIRGVSQLPEPDGSTEETSAECRNSSQQTNCDSEESQSSHLPSCTLNSHKRFPALWKQNSNKQNCSHSVKNSFSQLSVCAVYLRFTKSLL